MKTELIDLSPTRKEIKIEIEADAVRASYDRISDQYAQHATVPGFRPGHAPRSVVRSWDARGSRRAGEHTGEVSRVARIGGRCGATRARRAHCPRQRYIRRGRLRSGQTLRA